MAWRGPGWKTGCCMGPMSGTGVVDVQIDAAFTRVGDRGAGRTLRLALVNMPWARVDAPSIQCGLLQAIAAEAGHRCDVHYFNNELAAVLGADAYDRLAEAPQDRLNLIGEWLFSYAAFGEVTPAEEYLAAYPEVVTIWQEATGQDRDHLLKTRCEVLPEWLDEIARREFWADYDAVGLSSTFWQNTATLALGRRIKEHQPGTALVFGGANFDGDMGPEFFRAVPWLDNVVVGEGDLAWPALLSAIAAGDQTAAIEGVLRRTTQDTAVTTAVADTAAPRPPLLDTLPTPDYHDYFASLDRLGREAVLGRRPVRLPVELSRGCWWGEKHHCTFCGLNALGMAYRSKAPERALAELETLLAEYPVRRIEAVDNILDMKHIGALCGPLAERRWDLEMFVETKANLTREQLSALSRAGITSIQPGIESLSTPVLKLMRKGASRLINIRILKWARHYGVSVAWNLLAGFPGETDEDYHEQIRLLPLIHHLEPPGAASRVWLERFSPFFTDPSLGFADIRPRDGYRHIYPADIDHSKIAYFFDYEAERVVSEETFAATREAVTQWRTRWKQETPPSLTYVRLPDKLTLIDRRGEQATRAQLRGWRAAAYEACGDTPRSATRVADELHDAYQVSADAVRAFLDRCCESGVMVPEDGKYLSLALPRHPS